MFVCDFIIEEIMRSILMSLAVGTALSLGAAEVRAMPAISAAQSVDNVEITKVAEGCGPGFHRNFRGFCVPGGGFYGRPFVYGGPRCFIRDTVFGPRRVCR